MGYKKEKLEGHPSKKGSPKKHRVLKSMGHMGNSIERGRSVAGKEAVREGSDSGPKCVKEFGLQSVQ